MLSSNPPELEQIEADEKLLDEILREDQGRLSDPDLQRQIRESALEDLEEDLEEGAEGLEGEGLGDEMSGASFSDGVESVEPSLADPGDGVEGAFADGGLTF